MKKAAIYVRVSTLDQNPETQKQILIQYCEQHQIDYVVYEDTDSG